MKKQGLVVTGALVLAFTGAAPAEAAESRVSVSNHVVFWQSEPGANSFVTVDVAGGDLTIEDRDSTVSAGRGCRQRTPGRVTCNLAGLTKLNFSMGDDNDTVTVVDSRRLTLPTTIRGQDGFDHLTGGRGKDNVSGGASQDVIDGGRNTDKLNGGADYDTIDFESKTAPVRVSLDERRNDGVQGENENVIAFEAIIGGKKGDTLVGEDSSNLISGGPGADTIRGKGGDDYLFGGPGGDSIFGDAGDDDIRTAGGSSDDGAKDTARCGAGTDTVIMSSPDSAAGDCEYKRAPAS